MLRMKETSTKDFRELVNEIGLLMGFETTRDLELEEREIETPICKTKVKMLKGEDLCGVDGGLGGLRLLDGHGCSWMGTEGPRPKIPAPDDVGAPGAGASRAGAPRPAPAARAERRTR